MLKKIGQLTFLHFFSTPKKRPIVESHVELKNIWLTLREEYFPHREDIDSYQVSWSRRPQKRVLASCNIRGRKISVAKELRQIEYEVWLAPLLYHEMCHAILGEAVERNGRKRAWHGRQFKALEARHPHIPALDAWIKTGGWRQAVRKNRATIASQKRSIKRR